jgi:type I restriction enzyme, R subunit
MELILEVQTDEFWTDITAPLLESVRTRLRELIKLIEPQERKVVVSDFEDEIGEGGAAPFDSGAVGTDMSRFRRKVRRFLEDHQNHLAFQKIRRAERLTAQDIAELERMFIEEGVADADQLVAIDGGLGAFLRSLLGLDRQAAKKAFDDALDPTAMTANQIEFINLIIDHLTERGVVDPGLLYDSPFTDKNDQGLAGVFPMEQSQRVIGVLERLNRVVAA